MSLTFNSKEVFLSTPMAEYDLVIDVGENILMSVVDAYNSNIYDNIRSLFDARLCYDSGGFQFLTGKLENPDPQKTLEVYERLGYNKSDLLIQLDLPLNYFDSYDYRSKLIHKSAQFYHQMKESNDNIIPVVHGWTEQELYNSYEKLFDTDVCGVGSNVACSTRGVAVGTNLATTRSKPKVGNQHKSMAAVSSGTAEEKTLHTPAKVVFRRFGRAMRLLNREAQKVFVLGAGSMNMLHLAFASGAKYTDGSSWRIAARFWSIYVPEQATRSVGDTKTATQLKEKDMNILRDLHKEDDYPYTDLPFKEVMETLRDNKKEGFVTRAIHNAYVLKWETRNIANRYVNDSDGYWDYLFKTRWEGSRYWIPRAKMVKKELEREYVQTDLMTYLNFGSNSPYKLFTGGA